MNWLKRRWRVEKYHEIGMNLGSFQNSATQCDWSSILKTEKKVKGWSKIKLYIYKTHRHRLQYGDSQREGGAAGSGGRHLSNLKWGWKDLTLGDGCPMQCGDDVCWVVHCIVSYGETCMVSLSNGDEKRFNFGQMKDIKTYYFKAIILLLKFTLW